MSPDEVALEHVLWAASDGQAPAEVMEALGYPHLASADWYTVMMALRIAWRRLPGTDRVTVAEAIEELRKDIELKRAA